MRDAAAAALLVQRAPSPLPLSPRLCAARTRGRGNVLFCARRGSGAALRRRSQFKFGVRTKAHEAQRVGVRLHVEQHEVGFDVAVAVVAPVAGEGVVAVVQGGQSGVGGEEGERSAEVAIQCGGVPAFLFALEVAAELPRVFNLPRSDRP